MCAMSTKKTAPTALRDFREPFEINDARVGARARDNHLWRILAREPFDFVIINCFRFFRDAVGNEFVHLAGKIQRVAVSEVAAVREIHAEDRVAGLQRRDVNGNIRLRS